MTLVEIGRLVGRAARHHARVRAVERVVGPLQPYPAPPPDVLARFASLPAAILPNPLRSPTTTRT